jgi:hypothetical protein
MNFHALARIKQWLTTCPGCKGHSPCGACTACESRQDCGPTCELCDGDHKPHWLRRIRCRLSQPLFGFCWCGWPDQVLGWWFPRWIHARCPETLDLVDF